MKHTIQTGALLLVSIGLCLISFQQCKQKRSAQTELRQTQSKTRIDTVYKEGKTVTRTQTRFKTIKDTLFVENNKVYGTFRDSIISPELTLQATITASDLRAIDYRYSVREKIIREQSIVTVHDTLIRQVRRGQLIGVADFGLRSYSAGVQYQSRNRWGVTARYNWHGSDRFATVGVAYRLY